MIPELVTYANSLDTVTLALTNGANHLLLEDPKLSLRSYTITIEPGFDHLVALAKAAREQLPTVQLSYNLDILPQPHHDTLIKSLLKALQAANINRIRVQDPGVKNWIDSIATEFVFDLAMETGNQNSTGINYYTKHFKRQILSNELPAAQIQKLSGSEFEIQVHGPILIQYSPRRYLTLIESDTPESDQMDRYRLAYDTAYPGRQYPFYDNPHGHLMYLYFDRCLLSQLSTLMSLGLTAWLFDGRGESPSYLAKALTLYKKNLLGYLNNPDHFQVDSKDLLTLQDTAKRPLKPGFFKANFTDQDRKSAWSIQGRHLATILDFEKKKTMILEAKAPLTFPFEGLLITPKHQHFPIHISTATTPSGTPITSLQSGELFIAPWQKGIPAQSRIYTSGTQMLE